MLFNWNVHQTFYFLVSYIIKDAITPNNVDSEKTDLLTQYISRCYKTGIDHRNIKRIFYTKKYQYIRSYKAKSVTSVVQWARRKSVLFKSWIIDH